MLLQGTAGELEECVLPEISWAKITVNYRAGVSTSLGARLDQQRTWLCSPRPDACLLHQGVKWHLCTVGDPGCRDSASNLTAQGPTKDLVK